MSNTILNMSGSNKNKQTVLDKLKGIASVSEVLRMLGACAVITSMSMFLFQGWSSGNDLSRYIKLLSQTGLLTVAGLMLSIVIKEQKGARLFFGLALVSIVANFTILGALVYSMIQLDSQQLQYPVMLTWQAVDPAQFWMICAGAILFMLVVARFGFAVYARNSSKLLTLGFIGLNAFLLLPVRSAMIISLLIIAVSMLTWLLIRQVQSRQGFVLTRESKFALGILTLPSLIMVVRSLSLYNFNEVLLITISMIAYAFIRHAIRSLNSSALIQRVGEIVLLCLGFNVAVQVFGLLPMGISELGWFIMSMILLIFSYDQINQTNEQSWRKLVLSLTAALLLLLNIIPAVYTESIYPKLACLTAGIVLMGFTRLCADKLENNKFSYFASLILFFVGLLLFVLDLVELIQLSNWMVIGALGITVIMGASIYERFAVAKAK